MMRDEKTSLMVITEEEIQAECVRKEEESKKLQAEKEERRRAEQALRDKRRREELEAAAANEGLTVEEYLKYRAERARREDRSRQMQTKTEEQAWRTGWQGY